MCGSREGCAVAVTIDDTRIPICNCYSDCYEYGDCCTDVSHVENCLGMCMHTHLFSTINTGCLLISRLCGVCICACVGKVVI